MRLAWIALLVALTSCDDKEREKECEVTCTKVEQPALAECEAKFPQRDGGVPTAEEVDIAFARAKCTVAATTQAMHCFTACLKR